MSRHRIRYRHESTRSTVVLEVPWDAELGLIPPPSIAFYDSSGGSVRVLTFTFERMIEVDDDDAARHHPTSE